MQAPLEIDEASGALRPPVGWIESSDPMACYYQETQVNISQWVESSNPNAHGQPLHHIGSTGSEWVESADPNQCTDPPKTVVHQNPVANSVVVIDGW